MRCQKYSGIIFMSFLLILILHSNQVSAKIYPYNQAETTPATQDFLRTETGNPAFLTPLIEEGKLSEARDMARVTNLSDLVSYSGFFTVERKYNSNIFFWFFPAALNPQAAPLLIWLQGGPGSSSLFGLFYENGPFTVNKFGKLKFRKHSLTEEYSVIYFDNPVGTGFSFTNDKAGYSKNEEEAASALYKSLVQFLLFFPEYADQDLFITGESYAGKYIPVLAYKIHLKNQHTSNVRINLKGMAIGNGISDPPNMLDYGEYLYNVGLIDEKELAHFSRKKGAAKEAIRKGKWITAFNIIDRLLDGDLISTKPYFTNVTGMTTYFNILMTNYTAEMNYYTKFLERPDVRRALHVGNHPFRDVSTTVEYYFREAFYKSVVPVIVILLDAPEGYKFLFYNGQLDIIVAAIFTEKMLRRMNWSGKTEYLKSTKKIWKVGKEIAGYVRKAKNLTFVVMRNAGHFAPRDQPKWFIDMINRFTSNKPFS